MILATILPIDFGSFQFFLMIHFGPFGSIFVNFELFWVILIHFHSFLWFILIHLLHFGQLTYLYFW